MEDIKNPNIHNFKTIAKIYGGDVFLMEWALSDLSDSNLAHVAEILGQIPPKSPEIKTFLCTLAKFHKASMVREAAVFGLGYYQDDMKVVQFLERLRKTDTSNRVKEAIIETLNQKEVYLTTDDRNTEYDF